MKTNIKLNKSTFVRWKIHIDRSRMYIGYIQFFMMGFVFFKAYEKSSIGIFIFKYAYISIPILFLAFMFFSLLLGYWESKLGLKEEEQMKLTTQNPFMVDLIKEIKEIKAELNHMNKEKG